MPSLQFLICVWSPILQPLLVIATKLVYVIYFSGSFGVQVLCENISSV